MNLPRALFILIFLSLMTTSSAAQKPFFFNQPETFTRPIPVTATVASLLARDLANIPGCDERPFRETSSFEGARINLGAKRRALIVRVYEDCSHNADRSWFWILLKTPHGYRVLLRAGSDSLTVRNARTNGFPDLETNSATAEGNYRNVYEFDGSVYKVELCAHTNSATLKTNTVTCRGQ